MGTNVQTLTEERYAFIRGRLAAEGKVLASELAARFGVSEDTVRRDLRELAKAGECRKVYGGAVVTAARYPGPASARETRAPEAKARLAAVAARLIAPRQTIIIDAGTTNTAIARAIPRDIALTVATNSIAVASALAGNESVDLLVLGGAFDRESGGCLGGDALQAITQLSADMLFLGACGVDPGRGITAFEQADAELKRAMALSSGGIVVATTSDKLARAAPFRVAAPEAVTHLVVDENAPARVLAAFRRLGTKVHIAPGE
jgi:DeoR/GlpR family transcriptional regulator of sugar metabolism